VNGEQHSTSRRVSEPKRGADRTGKDATDLRCHGDVEVGCRMGSGMHRLQPINADPRIALGCLKSCMTKHLGHVSDIGAALEHQRGDGVAK